MYIPEYFRVREQADAVAFMRQNAFAILVSNGEDSPFATHVPVAIREVGESVVLRGHVAKENPHWRYLEQQPKCLTIFHGPHSFIPATLYATRETVPTWNYGAVHVYGEAKVFSSPESLLGMLHELVGVFEPAYAQQWSSLNETYRQRALSRIVGFEITTTRIEAKFKLSQNRTRDEQSNIIASLEKAEDSVVSGLARLMREQNLGGKKERE